MIKLLRALSGETKITLAQLVEMGKIYLVEGNLPESGWEFFIYDRPHFKFFSPWILKLSKSRRLWRKRPWNFAQFHGGDVADKLETSFHVSSSTKESSQFFFVSVAFLFLFIFSSDSPGVVFGTHSHIFSVIIIPFLSHTKAFKKSIKRHDSVLHPGGGGGGKLLKFILGVIFMALRDVISP